MFGSFVFNDNVSEIISPTGMKVTFLEGQDWEAEMGSKAVSYTHLMHYLSFRLN